jgi:putative ATPase
MTKPLATLLRPDTLEEFIGQDKLLSGQSVLKKMIQEGNISSMIFWGPPASGKTTLANIIAKQTSSNFHELSAVLDGKKDLVRVIEFAKKAQQMGEKSILFVDEIHRWNKAQQDALLPHIESGLLTLIGATTENPSFSIISPLLSRSRVFVFEQHSHKDLRAGLDRASKFLGKKFSDEVLEYISELSNGDMRFALNTLEIVTQSVKGTVKKSDVESAAQKFLRFDKQGEEHYNLISAVHKSLRSSNASAGVYWICRMLDGGVDPVYIARRLVRFASEDIGNASPTSLLLANSVFDTCKNIGMPECGVALVQLAEYLAKAPKSNTAYTAYNSAMTDVKQFGNLEVPLHFRNAPTKLMKEIGYGAGYEYDHDVKGKKSGQECMPDKLVGKEYF